MPDFDDGEPWCTECKDCHPRTCSGCAKRAVAVVQAELDAVRVGNTSEPDHTKCPLMLLHDAVPWSSACGETLMRNVVDEWTNERAEVVRLRAELRISSGEAETYKAQASVACGTIALVREVLGIDANAYIPDEVRKLRTELTATSERLDEPQVGTMAWIREMRKLGHACIDKDPCSVCLTDVANRRSDEDRYGKGTPAQILTCEVCRSPIEGLRTSMIFWDTTNPFHSGPQGPVTDLRLTHKQCDNDKLQLSAELYWFADAETALFRLAGLVFDYEWSSEHLKKLALVAWACSKVSDKKERKDCLEFLNIW